MAYKHVILWSLKEEYKNDEIRKGIKEGLESLEGKIPGMTYIHVQIDPTDGSNADAMLENVFETEEDLKAYAVNPDHNAIADKYVRPYTEVRLCLNFKIEN